MCKRVSKKCVSKKNISSKSLLPLITNQETDVQYNWQIITFRKVKVFEIQGCWSQKKIVTNLYSGNLRYRPHIFWWNLGGQSTATLQILPLEKNILTSYFLMDLREAVNHYHIQTIFGRTSSRFLTGEGRGGEGSSPLLLRNKIGKKYLTPSLNTNSTFSSNIQEEPSNPALQMSQKSRHRENGYFGWMRSLLSEWWKRSGRVVVGLGEAWTHGSLSNVHASSSYAPYRWWYW